LRVPVTRQRDLCERRQKRGPPERLGRLAQRPPDGRRGCSAIALREAQQRPAGLGLEPQSARLAVGLLCLVELTAQTAHLAPEVTGPRRGSLVHRPLEATARTVYLLERVEPFALEPQHLRAVHEAAACECEQVGLLFAPPRQHCGPLSGPPDLEYLLTGEADAA